MTLHATLQLLGEKPLVSGQILSPQPQLHNQSRSRKIWSPRTGEAYRSVDLDC